MVYNKMYTIEIIDPKIEVENSLSEKIKIENKKVNNEEIACIYIKSNVDKPVVLRHNRSVKIEINVEANVKVEIIEVVVKNNEDKSLLFDTYIGKNSILNHIVIEENASEKSNTTSRETNLEAYSQYVFKYLSLIDCNLSYTHNVNLKGEEAICDMYQVTLTNSEQKIEYNNKITHLAPYTKANIECIGATKDRSEIVFNTTGKIAKGYHSCSAIQSNRGIMIGDESKIIANPFLLIDEYDVVASHGATIGKMNDDELYYLMSRGISKQESYFLLIKGFFNKAILDITDEKWKSVILDDLSKKLEN